MESLRLEGNQYFPSDPERALGYYVRALDELDRVRNGNTTRINATSTAHSNLNALHAEYTKSAGNALTCLYKLHRTNDCIALAHRVLQLNPILAKAYVFLARSLLDIAQTSPATKPTNYTTCVPRDDITLDGLRIDDEIITDKTYKGRIQHEIHRCRSSVEHAVNVAWMCLCRALYIQVEMKDAIAPFMRTAVRIRLQIKNSKREQHEQQQGQPQPMHRQPSPPPEPSHPDGAPSPVPPCRTRSIDEACRSGGEEVCTESERSEPCLQLSIRPSDRAGRGVFAESPIPANFIVADTVKPFSIGVYEEALENGAGCCLGCGVAILCAYTTDNNNSDSCNTNGQANEQNVGDSPAVGKEEDDDANNTVSPLTLSSSSSTSSASPVVRCRACNTAVYCCRRCQQERADQHREYECRLFVELRQMLAILQQRQIDIPDEFPDVTFHCITTFAAWRAQRPGYTSLFSLDAHAHEVAISLHPAVPLMHSLFRRAGYTDCDESLLATLVGVVRCNALQISDPSGMPLGQGLHFHLGDNVTSYVNHSCAPNCAVDCTVGQIVTTRAILPQEELTIAYLPQLYWPAAQRQRALAERYFFTCHCARCEDSGHLESAWDSAVRYTVPSSSKRVDSTCDFDARVQSLCQRVRGLAVLAVSEGDASEVHALMHDASHHLFPFHYLMHDLRNTLSFLYTALGRRCACMRSCLCELLMWECTLSGSLPVKRLKLQNILACMNGMTEEEDKLSGQQIGCVRTDCVASAATVCQTCAVMNTYADAFGEYVIDLAVWYDVLEPDSLAK